MGTEVTGFKVVAEAVTGVGVAVAVAVTMMCMAQIGAPYMETVARGEVVEDEESSTVGGVSCCHELPWELWLLE